MLDVTTSPLLAYKSYVREYRSFGRVRPRHRSSADTSQVIVFRFYPANHSVVRAEYGIPCIPYEMTASGKNGFFSGFNSVDKVLDNVCRRCAYTSDIY